MSADNVPLYPVWRYHATKAACIVTTEAEDEALGAGWVDSPAKVTAPDAEPPPPPVADRPVKSKKKD